MTILLTRSSGKKRLPLGRKKKLVSLKCANNNLDGPILKTFLASKFNNYRQQPLFMCLT